MSRLCLEGHLYKRRRGEHMGPKSPQVRRHVELGFGRPEPVDGANLEVTDRPGHARPDRLRVSFNSATAHGAEGTDFRCESWLRSSLGRHERRPPWHSENPDLTPQTDTRACHARKGTPSPACTFLRRRTYTTSFARA